MKTPDTFTSREIPRNSCSSILCAKGRAPPHLLVFFTTYSRFLYPIELESVEFGKENAICSICTRWRNQIRSTSRCIVAHSASTCLRSVGIAPIEMRTIQRPSRIAGVR